MPDVGDVHDMLDSVSNEAKCTNEKVLKEERFKVADMLKAVNGWAAAVDFYLGWVFRTKWFEPPGEGVVKGEGGCHGATLERF